MQNLTLLFLSWALTLGISIIVGIFIIRKKIARTREFRVFVDNIERELSEYILERGIDELKQTEAGKDLLQLEDLDSPDLMLDLASASLAGLKNQGRMSAKSEVLGERHQRILEFLQDYQRENRFPPSISEIGEKIGVSSTSVVNYYLDQLEKRGLIERDRKISSGVRLAGVGEFVNTLRIPILGPIAAGLPLPELDPNIKYINESETNAVDIARSLLPPKEKGDGLYALEVKGESMIDAMINDGDIVILKPAMDVQNGEMVAVWLPRDNEATLKYFFKEKDRYRLQPANPTMKPIFVKKSEPLEIKGKVVMIIRRMDKIT